MDFKFKKSLIFSVGAGFLLLGFYFLFLTLANSFSHAIGQFLAIRYWILILVAGFGLQVGLYFYIRESFRQKQMRSPTGVVATSGGISTGSMIACCLHHLVDVLPIMGLAAAALFLIKYQILFLVIGILSNLIGIIIMLEIIQKNNLPRSRFSTTPPFIKGRGNTARPRSRIWTSVLLRKTLTGRGQSKFHYGAKPVENSLRGLAEGFLKKILVYDMARVKKLVIGLSLILVPITFFLANKQSNVTLPGNVTLPKVAGLPTETDSQGGISFEVRPADFSFENPVKFEIKIDTHSGSLDFNLTQISILEDDKGNQYRPLNWQGSGQDGHHRSGILSFSKLEGQPKSIKLIIQDIPSRIFEWELK